jgi:hypothetical protein
MYAIIYLQQDSKWINDNDYTVAIRVVSAQVLKFLMNNHLININDWHHQQYYATKAEANTVMQQLINADHDAANLIKSIYNTVQQ